MGVDVHGWDYTKAAKRAVSDAIRHSSLNFFRTLEKTPDDMFILLKIGVQKPQEVDVEAVAGELPYGTVEVDVSVGGLDVPAENGNDGIVIANAAVLVHLA